jgi:hypothetical protein
MSESSPSRIAIVGGGDSGALMAAHLLRGRAKNLTVTIVETRTELGRGLAYATDNPSHLLNVRAANMSAFADDPGQFARRLSTQRDAPAAADPEFRFVSRGLYGRYLESLIREHLDAPERRRALTEGGLPPRLAVPPIRRRGLIARRIRRKNAQVRGKNCSVVRFRSGGHVRAPIELVFGDYYAHVVSRAETRAAQGTRTDPLRDAG